MAEVAIEALSGRLMPDGAQRLDRSTDGSSVVWYYPDWRYKQSLVHKTFPPDTGAAIPEWEDDSIVMEVLSFMESGHCSSSFVTSMMYSVMRVHEENHNHGMASRIKAMIVAEMSSVEISDRLGVDEDLINLYSDIFFDVRTILGRRDRLASIIYPFDPRSVRNRSAAEMREYLWLAAAFSGGEKLLEYFLTGKFDLDTDSVDNCLMMIISMVTAQTLEYGVMLRSEGLPKSAHFDKFIAIQDIHTKVLGVRAQMEALKDSRDTQEMSVKWEEFINAVGLREAKGIVIEEEKEILSMDDLRSTTPAGDKDIPVKGLADFKTPSGISVKRL